MKRAFVCVVSLSTVLICMSGRVSALSQTPDLVDADRFRGIFRAVLGSDNNDQLNHLIYAPPAHLLDEGQFTRGQSCQVAGANLPDAAAREELCRMQQSYSQVDAKTLFNEGSTKSVPAVNLTELTQNLEQKDLLLVVVPGIFGEFIEKRAFEEVFEADSLFAREWKNAFHKKSDQELPAGATCESARNSSLSVCDEQEQLKRLTLDVGNRGQADVPMSALMNVGSIDDVSRGKIKARVVLFQMDGMTLESLGAQKTNAAIFNRRLEKFFTILGRTPKNIAFVGYSRGTAYALEMLSQAKELNKPWLKNVKAVISLGGVVFGSALADDGVVNNGSALNCRLRLAQILEDTLTELPAPDKSIDDPQNAEWVGRNLLGWAKFITGMARLTESKDVKCEDAVNQPVGQISLAQAARLGLALAQSSSQQVGADPEFALKLLLQQAVKFGLASEDEVEDGVVGTATALLGVTSCLTTKLSMSCLPGFKNPMQFNRNLRRFKRLVASALQGVRELTTDSRLNWWRTHSVPVNNIRYYSVSGTMADPSSGLIDNQWAYNPGSPDDKGLIQNWRDFKSVNIAGEYAGVALNDSQVAIYKTVFWPGLIAQLNPQNAGLKSTPLAIVGTHHWGMALPIVTQVVANRFNGLLKRNPFPRAALLESLAIAVAEDIRNQEGQ